MNEDPPRSQCGHTTHAGNCPLPLVQRQDGTQSSGDPRMEQLPVTFQVPAGLPGLRALYCNHQNVSPGSKRFPTVFYPNLPPTKRLLRIIHHTGLEVLFFLLQISGKGKYREADSHLNFGEKRTWSLGTHNT